MQQTLYLLIALMVMGFIIAVIMGIRNRYINRAMVLSAVANRSLAVPTIREIEMAKPWRERVFKPTLNRLTGFGRIFTPARNLEQLQRDLIMAGLVDKFTVTDFLGLRFLSGAVCSAIAFLTTSLNRPVASALLIALALFMLGLYLPNFWLRSQVRERQRKIARALPDALDMMSICVDAGLGFEAAIQKVAIQADNELALEMRRVISEIRVGVTRGDALRHLVDRTGVSDIANFVAVLIQADQLGIAIRNVLHTQAEQMRVRRRQRAQEAAQKAPLKMLFPMTIFIFPAMFVVILGPAIPRFMEIFR
ncbi:MAG: type II secretion system F family protein [Caldilineaceae bacterium]